jgi:hypothetical protein
MDNVQIVARVSDVARYSSRHARLRTDADSPPRATVGRPVARGVEQVTRV